MACAGACAQACSLLQLLRHGHTLGLWSSAPLDSRTASRPPQSGGFCRRHILALRDIDQAVRNATRLNFAQRGRFLIRNLLRQKGCLSQFSSNPWTNIPTVS